MICLVDNEFCRVDGKQGFLIYKDLDESDGIKEPSLIEFFKRKKAVYILKIITLTYLFLHAFSVPFCLDTLHIETCAS